MEIVLCQHFAKGGIHFLRYWSSFHKIFLHVWCNLKLRNNYLPNWISSWFSNLNFSSHTKEDLNMKIQSKLFSESLSMSQDLKICDNYPGIVTLFSKLQGCPLEIKISLALLIKLKNTRILSTCVYDIIFVLEYSNL